MVKKLFQKMLPSQVLSSLAMAICMQVDIILIGQLIGVDGVASFGIANPILIIGTAMAGLLSTGVATVCSRYVGRGDMDQIDKNFSSSVAIAILISVLFTAVIFITTSSLVSFLGAESGTVVYDMTKGYLRGWAIGIPAMLLRQTLTSYLFIAGKRKLVTIATIAITTIDIVLDIVAVLVFDAGMFGMGLATAISECVGVIIVLTYFFGKKCMFSFKKSRIEAAEIKEVAVAGSPLAINQGVFTVFLFVMNQLLMKHGGSMAVAAYSVVASLSTVFFTISGGVGETTRILSGIFYGEEDRGNIEKTLKQGVFWAIVLNVIVTIIVLIFTKPLAMVYVSGSEETLELTARALRFYIFAIIPMGICVLFKNYYSCIKKVSLSIIISIFENGIFVIGSCFVLSMVIGLNGLFLSNLVAETLAAFLVVIFALIKNKKLSLNIGDLSLLDGKIASAETVTSFVIMGNNDIPVASQGAQNFCEDAGCDKKKAFFIGLCIEEMAAAIMEKGFKDPNGELSKRLRKKDMIEVRLIDKPDAWLVRIRDNCNNFDFANFMKLHKGDDDIASLGVRMVYKMVTDAEYINSLGFNCLLLTLEK